MLHLYHIPKVRIKAGKDHRTIQCRQYAFLRGGNQVHAIMPHIGIIMGRNDTIHRFVEKYAVGRDRIRVQDCQVIFLRFFKILHKFLFLLRLRNLIVRIHSRQRIDLANRIDRHRPRQDTRHIVQIKGVYLDHPFQRIGTQGILHDFLTDFHIQITRQVVSYRCLDNDKGSKSDQQKGKQAQHGKR